MSVAVKKREQGFTLIEMITVVAIIAIIAMIATISVSQTLKKQRVEAAGYQLQSFLESASVYARERSRGVFVWLALRPSPDGGSNWWYCYLIEDTDGDDILDYVLTDPAASPPGNPASNEDTYLFTEKVFLPEDIVIAGNNGATTSPPPNLPNVWPGPNNWPQNGGDFLLLCDPRGLPFNPSLATVRQINNPIAISLTHLEMTTRDLTPGIRYDITISPLWHTRIDRVLY